MLICAGVLLVATDGAGKPMAGGNGLDLALAGAALGELAACRRVAVKDKRLVVLDARPGGDPLLDRALGVFAQHAGKKPEKVLPRAAKGMTSLTYQRLVEEHAVRIEKGGFLRSDRHPVVDGPARAALVDAGGRVLAGTATPDLQSGSLVALLSALGIVTKVYDSRQFGVSGLELKRRAKAVGKQDWAAGAAAAAIKSAQNAMNAAMIGSSVAISSAALGN